MNPRTPHQASEPGTLNLERDTRMTSNYIQVLVLETAILIALFFFGRAFS